MRSNLLAHQIHGLLMKKLITYLVEDNVIVLDNLIETLREIADVKVMAHSATQAEAIRWLDLHNGNWHLAIVDLFLKQGSGLGVLAGCRHRRPYQKIVVLSNYATDEIRVRATALGADAVFDKSTELDGLIDFCLQQTASLKHEAPQQAQATATQGNRTAAGS
ncbi:MAG: response regulator [Polaromonas sp.]|nr:response regulator [Polaromonas sp.]